MKPRPVSLGVLLWMLCAWASLAAVLVWWRQPAAAPPLPARIALGGRELYRRPGKVSNTPLPAAISLLAGADYQASDGTTVLLRWLAHGSSGSGISFDMPAINRSLLGPGRNGICQVFNPHGRALLGSARNDADLQVLLRQTNPAGADRLAWALGLRGWRENRCLFIGERRR